MRFDVSDAERLTLPGAGCTQARIHSALSQLDDGGVPSMKQEGRILRDLDLRDGQIPAIGDTVILEDFARCLPRSALDSVSTKGRWWLRPFKWGARTLTLSRASRFA